VGSRVKPLRRRLKTPAEMSGIMRILPAFQEKGLGNSGSNSRNISPRIFLTSLDGMLFCGLLRSLHGGNFGELPFGLLNLYRLEFYRMGNDAGGWKSTGGGDIRSSAGKFRPCRKTGRMLSEANEREFYWKRTGIQGWRKKKFELQRGGSEEGSRVVIKWQGWEKGSVLSFCTLALKKDSKSRENLGFLRDLK